MEITKKSFKKEINEIESFQATWRQKCRRNLSIYEFTRNLDLQSQNDTQTVGFYSNDMSPENDHTTAIQENVIRSVIDTLSSKIASQKVTPFFNTVNGTFREMQITKAAQVFFDTLYDELDVNKTVVQAFTDSCITDRGVIFIDRDFQRIERIQPWQFFFNPREYAYNKLTRCAIKRTDYPTSLLSLKTDLDTVTLHEYWDTKSHIHVKYIEELNKTWVETWEPDIIPFVILRWSNPIKSSSSTSVVDLLFGIQKQINYLLSQIKDASQSAFGNKYIIPSDSNIRVNQLSNRNGEIIEYDPQMTANGAVPITVVASPFMDNQWFSALEQFKLDAYEMVGISQLSATSKKPKGLDSGVALQTMEDIESDRFECQLNTVIKSYVDIAKVCMLVFNPNDTILPNNRYRGNWKWKDFVNLKDSMTIQFSSLDKISKDPATKQKIITEWINNGWISRAHAAQLMEIPDAENGYSLLNNSINAVEAIIDNCINHDIIDVPLFIDDELLKEEIISTCLSLTSAGLEKNKPDINKLIKLYEYVESRNKNAITTTEYAAMQAISEEVNVALQQGMQQAQSIVEEDLAKKTQELTEDNIMKTAQEEEMNKTVEDLTRASKRLLALTRRFNR